jgi:hypothetical protein
MSFNKRYINYTNTLSALQSDTLSSYYGKADAFIFQDTKSVEVYELYTKGKTPKEILNILENQKIEE